jgi:uncharacterized membrane protein
MSQNHLRAKAIIGEGAFFVLFAASIYAASSVLHYADLSDGILSIIFSLISLVILISVIVCVYSHDNMLKETEYSNAHSDEIYKQGYLNGYNDRAKEEHIEDNKPR